MDIKYSLHKSASKGLDMEFVACLVELIALMLT